jgi:hypothetical protein
LSESIQTLSSGICGRKAPRFRQPWIPSNARPIAVNRLAPAYVKLRLQELQRAAGLAIRTAGVGALQSINWTDG